MPGILRSTPFWMTFVLLSLLSCVGAFILLPRAFPIIQIPLTINRTQAIDRANTVLSANNLNSTHSKTTASFIQNKFVQTFIELEGGGKDYFTHMMHTNLYQPYLWHIRYFTPFDPNHIDVFITPDGKPYGFRQELSENLNLPSLSQDNARELAQKHAHDIWDISLEPYRLIENSTETKVSGRVDHRFVYERTKEKAGEGFYHLEMVVRGNAVSALEHTVNVPDAFTRRYALMRSANQSIAWGATIAMILLYVLCGCFIGLSILMRKGWVLWRLPIICALVISSLQLLSNINYFPLAWMQYNTAIDPLNFTLQCISSYVYQFVFTLLFITIITAAAESLGRYAFGHHPQLWHVWRRPLSPSITILGTTLTGYLFVPLMLMFCIGFYLIMTSYFSWWLPAEPLMDPNILATYIPWLSPLAGALSAGFIEECLFRAVPLATAALVGKYLNKQSLCITIGFILQAVIFGAAHANYPMQPSYARLIELMIPSFGFGGLYLAFGLLPSIIAHTIYDVVWMAMPLFVSHAPDAWIHKLCVILCSCIPLLIIFYGRARSSSWTQIPAYLYNYAWQPEDKSQQQQSPVLAYETDISRTKTYLFIGAALCAMILWVSLEQFKNEFSSMSISRPQAFAIATKAMEEKNIVIDNKWTALSILQEGFNESPQHRYVWQKTTKDIYTRLLGSYLKPIQWIVRYVQFEGDLIERAEEYQISITTDGSVYRVLHQLPESRPGKDLQEIAARQIALEAAHSLYGLSQDMLKEISAVQFKRPNRKDWLFTFEKIAQPLVPEISLRTNIGISGDEVVDHCQFVHVPEDWMRAQQNRDAITRIIKVFATLLLYLLFILAALLMFFNSDIQRAYSRRTILPIATVVSCSLLISFLNSLPVTISSFDTSRPVYLQLFMALSSVCIGTFVWIIGLSSLVVYTLSNQGTYYTRLNRRFILASAGLGVIFIGCTSAVYQLMPSIKPGWYSVAILNTYIPSLQYLVSIIPFYLIITAALWLLVNLANYIASKYTYGQPYGTALIFLLSSGILACVYCADNIPLLIGVALSMSLISITGYQHLVRFDRRSIPLATAGYSVMGILQHMCVSTIPGTIIYCLITIVVIAGIATYWVLNTRTD